MNYNENQFNIIYAIRDLRNELYDYQENLMFRHDVNMDEVFPIVDKIALNISGDDDLLEAFMEYKYGYNYRQLLEGIWQKRAQLSSENASANLIFGHMYVKKFQDKIGAFRSVSNYKDLKSSAFKGINDSHVSVDYLVNILGRAYEVCQYFRDNEIFQDSVIPALSKVFSFLHYYGAAGNKFTDMVMKIEMNKKEEANARDRICSRYFNMDDKKETVNLLAEKICRKVQTYFVSSVDPECSVDCRSEYNFAENSFLVTVRPRLDKNVFEANAQKYAGLLKPICNMACTHFRGVGSYERGDRGDGAITLVFNDFNSLF